MASLEGSMETMEKEHKKKLLRLDETVGAAAATWHVLTAS